jgi:DNA-binding phage protein
MTQPLTRDFRESVREELQNKEFRHAFLSEALHDIIAGDFDLAKLVLREYINGTVGFIAAGKALNRSPKSLMRMLSASGNPQARNLLDLLAYLQKTEGITFEVRAVKAKPAKRKAA